MKLKPIPALLTLATTLAVLGAGVIFAIGGSLAQAAQPHAVAPAAKTTIITTRHSSIGTFLVGPNGRTLYLWKADTRNHSTCFGDCAAVWPPLMLSGKLKAEGGVKASLLGSIARPGGREVTYNGWPLYYYISDTKAGQITGEDSPSFGAPWYVVSTAGKAIITKASIAQLR